MSHISISPHPPTGGPHVILVYCTPYVRRPGAQPDSGEQMASRFLADTGPYRVPLLAVFAAAAYLCLVNLDHAALWHDEAPVALIANNFLQQGDITGWDGRNLVGGTNGRTLNEELQDVLPPLMYVLNAAGIAAFGLNEVGARIVPALIGILTLALFFLFLRQQLEGHPRLIFLIFLFVAWSPQLLLYFRQSRYYAFMAFSVVAAFYLYERYRRGGRPVWLAALTGVAALAFFNHYVAGAALMLSLAAWHLIFHARETTPKEWLALASCGLFVVALGTAYFAFIGLIGGGRVGFSEFTGTHMTQEHDGGIAMFALKMWIYVRELFTTDWVSWPVFLWFAGMLLLVRRWRKEEARRASLPRQRRREPSATPPRKEPGAGLPVFGVGKIVLMGVLFALLSATLSPQNIAEAPFADLRYYMGALPLLLAMKGLFAEWAWQKSRVAGAAAIGALLFTSVGAAPFNVILALNGEPTLGAHLPRFVQEVHRPYRDSIRVVSDYLLEHADKDDLVFVGSFNDREALMFRVGHHVRFCCFLDRNSPLPRARIEALDAPLLIEENVPEWVVALNPRERDFVERVMPLYKVERLDVHHYPTQRPEINLHAFEPLPARHGVYVLHRRGGP